MSKKEILGRASVATIGAVLLAGVAGAAFADEVDHGSGNVDVSVAITELVEPGVLAMSVASDSTTLTETGTDPTVREFTGTLPTVSVTDTRAAGEIASDAFWYVLGSSSDFVGDAAQAAIGAGHLGWAPALVGGTDAGEVAAGDPVDTVMDAGPDAVGLVDQELLAMASSSPGIAPTGSWTVNAGLFLRTPITVAPGNYTGTLTLSLFEFSE